MRMVQTPLDKHVRLAQLPVVISVTECELFESDEEGAQPVRRSYTWTVRLDGHTIGRSGWSAEHGEPSEVEAVSKALEETQRYAQAATLRAGGAYDHG